MINVMVLVRGSLTHSPLQSVHIEVEAKKKRRKAGSWEGLASRERVGGLGEVRNEGRGEREA